MNALNYLESRFVESNINLPNGQITLGMGKNRAVSAWMAVALFVTTVFHFFVVLLHYLAVCLRIIPRPRPAEQLAADYKAQKARENAAMRKIMEDLANKQKAGTTQKVDA